MKQINISKVESVSIAAGGGKRLFQIDLSGLTSNVVGIELFVVFVSGGNTSMLYARKAELVNTSLTNQAENVTYDSTYSYSDTLVNCVNNIQYTYDQSGSVINILVDNTTGSAETVSYSFYYTLDYI